MIRLLVAVVPVAACIFAVSVLVGLAKADKDITEQVKSGQKILTCHLQQGEVQVSPDKIVRYSEGRWYFTNGSAIQCEVK